MDIDNADDWSRRGFDFDLEQVDDALETSYQKHYSVPILNKPLKIVNFLFNVRNFYVKIGRISYFNMVY